MSDDYEAYEKACKKIRESNNELLSQFENWLLKKNLTQKTIDRHINNVAFYINEFLLYEDAENPEEGIYSINMFLGYWFIRKAMWASAASIKGNAASLKKFYIFMQEIGRVETEDLEDMKKTIKENMDEWIATVRRYDDPSITDMGEVWGL